jgi:hypothetical protein
MAGASPPGLATSVATATGAASGASYPQQRALRLAREEQPPLAIDEHRLEDAAAGVQDAGRGGGPHGRTARAAARSRRRFNRAQSRSSSKTMTAMMRATMAIVRVFIPPPYP